MKDKITYLTIYDNNATIRTSFRIENGEINGKAQIKKVSFQSTKHIGRMYSEPLTEQEKYNIITILMESNSNTIGIGLSERSYGFIKQANLQKVKHLITKCSNNK